MSLRVDGTNYYLTANGWETSGNGPLNFPLVDNTTPWTVAFWYLPVDVSAVRFCVTFYSTTTTDRLSFGQNTTSLICQSVRSGGTTNRTGSTGNFKAGKWCHCAYTLDGTTWKLYSNGVLISSGSEVAGTYSQAQNVIIGSSFNQATGLPVSFASGLLCEIGIWSAALQRDAVYQLGNQGKSCDDVQTNTLVSYWPCRNRTIANFSLPGKVNELRQYKFIASFGGNVLADGSPLTSGDPPILLEGDLATNSAVQNSYPNTASTTYAMALSDGYANSDVLTLIANSAKLFFADGTLYANTANYTLTYVSNCSEGSIYANSTTLNLTTATSLTGGLTNSDSTNISINGKVIVSDAFTNADTLAYGLLSTITFSDGFVHSDLYATNLTLRMSLLDGFVVDDSENVRATSKISNSDGSIFTESLVNSYLGFLTLSEESIFSDSKSITVSTRVSFADGLTETDVYQEQSQANVLVNDASSYSDLIAMVSVVNTSLNDQFSFSDALTIILFVIPLHDIADLEFLLQLSNGLQFDIKTTDKLYWSSTDEGSVLFRLDDNDDLEWMNP